MAASSNPRAHTGSRRNEAARAAILAAAGELLATHGSSGVTVDRIAAHAGVGRQTIYRWWPSKDAVLLDALVQSAEQAVPAPDTGDLREDLTVFLRETFTAAGMEHNRQALIAAVVAAQDDPGLAATLEEFLTRRRAALAELIERDRARGKISNNRPVDLVVEQAFGVLWYRILFQPNALHPDRAPELADALSAQLVRGE
ncbi:TetR/AcrR family transcriptional regulator [Nocardia pneumoniae]|uniref:TetR/AcrR family transcriptional regulator n=1 Tax=Nocardia pneumoniae TaxID=228601 RepID=UPI000313E366|nr:TetR/AcrR family transcriptional regulator [Nocardia pneumoniae]